MRPYSSIFSEFLSCIPACATVALLLPTLSQATTPPAVLDYYTATFNLTSSSVQLQSVITPVDSQTTAWFEWGSSTAYGETVKAQSRPDYGVAEGIVVTAILRNLTPRTTYHYRAVARNDAGISYGHDHIFVTPLNDAMPTLIALDADGVTSRSARVRVLLNAHGSLCTGFFEWGLSASPNNSSASTPQRIIGDDTAGVEFSATVGPLMPDETYYYRAWVNRTYSTDQWASSDIRTFITDHDTTAVAIVVPVKVARLGSSGHAIPFGVHSYATSCSDPGLGEWELPPRPPPGSMDARFLGRCLGLGLYMDLRNYHSPTQIDTYHVSFLAGGIGYPVTVSWPELESLYAGPVRLITMDETVDMMASTQYSITNPEIEDFRIIAGGPKPRRICPMIARDTVSRTSPTSAHLRATIYPNGYHTSAWFQWGTSVQYGHETTPALLSDSLPTVTLEFDLTGLDGHSVYHYRTVAKNLGGLIRGPDRVFTTGGTPGGGLPAGFKLHQNYPNPFNSTTLIRYDLPVDRHVVVKVIDLLGREVRTLVDEEQSAGFKTILFDAAGLPSAMYFCRITAGGFQDSKELVLVR